MRGTTPWSGRLSCASSRAVLGVALVLATTAFMPHMARGANLPADRAGAGSQESAPSQDPASRRLPSTQLSPQQQADRDRIVGTVTSEGEPVIGATVEVGGQGAVTGPDGSFTVEGVSGQVTVTVRMIGYDTWTRELNVSGETRIPVELTPAGVGDLVAADFDLPVRWDWFTWFLLLARLIGFEIGLRSRRSDRRSRRRAAIIGVTAGGLVGRTALFGYYFLLGIELTPIVFVDGILILAGSALMAALVFAVLDAANGTVGRIFAGAGAGIVVGAVVGVALFTIRLLLGGVDPTTSDLLAISIQTWAGAIEGALLATWLTVRPMLARPVPPEHDAWTESMEPSESFTESAETAPSR